MLILADRSVFSTAGGVTTQLVEDSSGVESSNNTEKKNSVGVPSYIFSLVQGLGYPCPLFDFVRLLMVETV